MYPQDSSMPIQFSETDKLPDIRFDFVFKSVFSRDSSASRGALSSLVSAFIGRPLTVQTITANEPPNESASQRRIRFDITCIAQTGELINVEMCFNPNPYELSRSEYYASRLHAMQGIRGIDKDFSDLKEVYQIAILDKLLFFDDQDLVHRIQLYDVKHLRPMREGKITIITMELQKVELFAEKPVEELTTQEAWGIFFAYLTDPKKRSKINKILRKEEGITMTQYNAPEGRYPNKCNRSWSPGEATVPSNGQSSFSCFGTPSDVLITITDEMREWVRRESEFKYELDEQAALVTAKRAGRAEGLKEGREEGIEIGREEERLNLAQKALAEGATLEFVQKITGLDRETIEKLWEK